MSQAAWIKFYQDQRELFIGGESESIENGVVYRSPISDIEIRGDCIFFLSPWVAVCNHGRWEKMPTNVPLFVNMNDVEPRQDSVGRFTFNLPFLGIATLFPNTWPNKLDPSRVHGLNEEGETT